MSLNPRLAELFERNSARYQVLPHVEAFTAQEVAQRAHVTGRRVAKVVVVRDATGSEFMVVLPASEQVDLEKLSQVTQRTGLRLVDENEIRRRFPDCELGAMPPFGNVYGMSMVVDPCLSQRDLFFQAGNHREVVRMSYDEFDRLAEPFIGDSCVHACGAHV